MLPRGKQQSHKARVLYKAVMIVIYMAMIGSSLLQAVIRITTATELCTRGDGYLAQKPLAG